MARIPPLALLPPVLFAGIAAMFLWGMGRENPDDLPSALIGRPAPALPQEVIERTAAKYREAYARLTGRALEPTR